LVIIIIIIVIIAKSTVYYTINYHFAHDIDVILQDQDVRQRHHPGEQNRKDERYSVDPIDGFDEEQYNIQSLSLD